MPLPPLLDQRRGLGLAGVAALTLVQGGAAGLAVFATRGLFEAMHGGGPLPVAALGALVTAGEAIAAARVAARTLGESIGQDYARQIRAALFDHAARMPASAVTSRRAGYVALRFVGDLTTFRNWLSLGLPTLIAAAILIPAVLGVLWLLDPVFAKAVLPVFAVTLVLIGAGGLGLVPLQRRLRVRRAQIAAEMAERMPLAPYLDRLGRRGNELGHLDKRTDAMVAVALRHRLLVETLKALPDLAAGICAALIILAGHRAGLGTGSIAAALAVLGLLLAPLRNLGAVWNHRASYLAAAIKAAAALSRSERDLYRAGKSLPKGPVDLRFEAVPLPSGASLTGHAKGGGTIALTVNELDSEAVLDLLLALEAPAGGRVLLSGIDLRDFSRGTLRREVLRFGPSPAILHGSLRRALVMGCDARPDDASLERMARDCGLGGLLDRIGGLAGTVREGGKSLTASERLGVSQVRIRLAQPRLVLIGPEVPEPATAWLAPRHGDTRPATVLRLRIAAT